MGVISAMLIGSSSRIVEKHFSLDVINEFFIGIAKLGLFFNLNNAKFNKELHT